MAVVKKVVRVMNKGDHAIVVVQTEHGDEEYTIYVGGQIETYHHKGQNRAFVSKKRA